MRRRLVVAPSLRSATVAAALAACSAGAQGASVQTVFSAENALYGAGYSVGQADGWIDDSLRAAVKKYQADHPDLTATGELDAPTLGALGISGSRSQLMAGNVVASNEAARKELGLLLVTRAPEPAPAAKAEPEPAKSVATPEPVIKPDPVVASAPKVIKPASQAEPDKKVEPEPERVTKTRSEPSPTQNQADPEPTSEPIVIASSARSSSRDEPTAAPEPKATTKETGPEEPVNVASVDNPEKIEVAPPQEPTAAEDGPEKVSSESVVESQPKDGQGNVITRMFDFLFGWMV